MRSPARNPGKRLYRHHLRFVRPHLAFAVY